MQRDLRAHWPRLVGLACLSVLVWMAMDIPNPRTQELEIRSCEKLVLQVFQKALLKDHGTEGVLVVKKAHTANQVPGCQQIVKSSIRESAGPRKTGVIVDPAASDLVLTVASDRMGTGIELSAELVRGTENIAKITRFIAVPDGTSLLPPLLAVILALLFRQILISLLIAIGVGAFLLTGGDPWTALERTGEVYIYNQVTDPWNLYILGFTVILVGTIHICIAMGGMQGLVNVLTRKANTVKSTQISTALMGLAVFFDDYANSVVVGAAARNLTDAKRISREKLAYIVDSTAAPIAGLAVISTWIGMEIALFQDQMDEIGHIAGSGYDFFFDILPYRFYCIFALALVFIVALTGRDFGPMLKAERRARATGQVAPDVSRRREKATQFPETQMKAGVKAAWYNGIIPILVVLFGTFVTFIIVGSGRIVEAGTPFSWLSISDLGQAFIRVGDDNISILFWASVAGLVSAVILALGQRLLTVREIVSSWFRGARAMLPALAILILAMGIRAVTVDMGTDRFLVALLSDVSLWLLPVASFLLAAAVAFSTGTSWGTMAILLPVAIPLAANLGSDDPARDLILLLVAASVLDGAIFGDHCSFISDTTVMSSLSSSCDHIEHVRTQFPYAMLGMVAAAGVGYILLAIPDVEFPLLLTYPLGILFMWGFMRLVGRPSE